MNIVLFHQWGCTRHSVGESLHNHSENVFFRVQNNTDALNKLQNWNWPLYNIIQYTILRTLYLYLLHIYSMHCSLLLIYYLLLDTGTYGAIGRVRLFWIIKVLITVAARVVYCTLYVWFLIRYKRWPRVQE